MEYTFRGRPFSAYPAAVQGHLQKLLALHKKGKKKMGLKIEREIMRILKMGQPK